MKLRTLCIIPARSGSKEIRNKNIFKLFKNETLIETSIKFAMKLKFLDKIIVSTDSNIYLKIANKLLKDKNIKLRSKKFSKDNSLMIDVIKYELSRLKKLGLKFDLILILQPNCPFRNLKDFYLAQHYLKNNKAESVVTIKEVENHPSRMLLINKFSNKISKFIKSKENSFQSRQNLSKIFIRAGSMYFFKTKNIFKYNSILGNKNFGLIVKKAYGVNIDNLHDLIIAKHYAKNFNKK